MKEIKLNKEIYNLLAGTFEYPNNELEGRIRNTVSVLEKDFKEAANHLKIFLEYLESTSIVYQEELYTRSFDVQAITTLDIGYVLFGDDYKRGELLVNLSREHKEAGNECSNELADHLPNVLRLLPNLSDRDILIDLATIIVIPAVDKIIKEFHTDKQSKKEEIYFKHHRTIIDKSENYGSVYVNLLLAVQNILLKDFKKYYKVTDVEQSFIQSINSEMEIN